MNIMNLTRWTYLQYADEMVVLLVMLPESVLTHVIALRPTCLPKGEHSRVCHPRDMYHAFSMLATTTLLAC